jgi:putative copper resistance protein D
VDEAFIVCRLLHFAAAMTVFGVGVFQSALAPPDLRRSLARPLWRLVAAASLILAVTMVGWPMLEAGEVGEGWADVYDPQIVMSVLLDTDFGRVWCWRLGLAAVLIVLAFVDRRPSRPMLAVLAGLLLGSLGLIGHAAMQSGLIGWLHSGNHALHLLAAGFWFGSLVPLLFCLRDRSLSKDALAAVRRFSALGHVAVAAVIITGVVDTWLVLGKLPIDLASPYQALLATKIALVAVMVAAALANRYVLLPPLLARSRASSPMLRYSAMGEVVLGLGVLAVVSALGTLEPV